jgi:DUF4097 and DUF4098 domain-containing protein YvlB
MTARSDRRLAMTFGAVLSAFFVLCSATQVASWTIGSVDRDVHEVIPGPVKALTLEAHSATVTLVPSSTDQVVIDGHASGTLHTPKLKIRPSGSHVRVDGGCPNITFGHCEADIIVAVPAGTAVSVESGSGDISAEGVTGNVQLETASGDVSASNLRGANVRLESHSGDVSAGDLRVQTVVATTASGDVTMQLASVPQTVEAETSSGDVVVLVPPGTEEYSVDAETNSGDRTIGVATSSRSPRIVKARTSSGDVAVDYGP